MGMADARDVRPTRTVSGVRALEGGGRTDESQECVCCEFHVGMCGITVVNRSKG